MVMNQCTFLNLSRYDGILVTPDDLGLRIRNGDVEAAISSSIDQGPHPSHQPSDAQLSSTTDRQHSVTKAWASGTKLAAHQRGCPRHLAPVHTHTETDRTASGVQVAQEGEAVKGSLDDRERVLCVSQDRRRSKGRPGAPEQGLASDTARGFIVCGSSSLLELARLVLHVEALVSRLQLHASSCVRCAVTCRHRIPCDLHLDLRLASYQFSVFPSPDKVRWSSMVKSRLPRLPRLR